MENAAYTILSVRKAFKIPTEKKILTMELTANPEKEPYVKTQISELVSEKSQKRSEMTKYQWMKEPAKRGVFVICKSDLMQQRNIYARKSNSLRCCKYHIIHCGIDQLL